MSRNKSMRHLVTVSLLLAMTALVSGQVASVVTVGSGWGQTAPRPDLVSTRPVLGETAFAFAQHFSPGRQAWFLASVPPASPTVVAGPLVAYVDLTDFAVYGPVMTDANGTVIFPVTLDLPLNFAGQQVMIQMQTGYYMPATLNETDPWETEVESSNGLLWTFGTE